MRQPDGKPYYHLRQVVKVRKAYNELNDAEKVEFLKGLVNWSDYVHLKPLVEGCMELEWR